MNGYEFSYSRSGATRYFRNLEEAERFATYLNLPEAERQEIDAAHSLRYFYA
jgi:hypothetical protein